MSQGRMYTEYLALDELLSLQRPRSDGPEHDEMLFIVIHQVYELWFKQVLHEVDYLSARMAADDPAKVHSTLKRILTILKTLVGQIDVLETMTPLDFLTFRDRLESGSGFQSFQFRELEIALGMKDERVLERYAEGDEVHTRLRRRLDEPSLWQRFLRYAAARGAGIPDEALERSARLATSEDESVQKALLHVYREHDPLVQTCELLVDLDEGLQEWRYRHVKMVQRTIGTKIGTGGSEGAEYLKTTLFRSLFPDLWAIRTAL